jgi:hypothetical protein
MPPDFEVAFAYFLSLDGGDLALIEASTWFVKESQERLEHR